MEDVEVVDCQVQQKILQVHCCDGFPEVLVYHFGKFSNERAGGRVGFRGEVDE